MDDLLPGLVVAVAAIPVGTQTAADVAINATVLVLDDVIDFSPTGGQVTIDGTVLDYSESDDDAGTLTLATPLTVALTEGADVAPFPPRIETTAMVLIDGGSDPIPATVPWHMQDALPVGVREESNREKVRLTRDGEWSWAIFDLPAVPLDSRGSAVRIPYDEDGAGLAGGIDFMGNVVAQDLSYQGFLMASADTLLIDGVPLSQWIAANAGAPATTTTRVDTFDATATSWWEGDNLTNARASDNQYVGYAASQPDEGNRRSAIWFDSAAIATAVAGRTGTKARLQITVWEGGNGKTIRLGSHSDATVRTNWNNITDKVEGRVSKSGVNEGTTVWVELTPAILAGLMDGTIKGLLVGPGATNDSQYKFSYRGAAHLKRPVLEITTTP